MSGKVGVDYILTFAVRNADGSPRTGLGAAEFAAQIRNPQNTASSAPAVAEVGGGQYRTTIPAAFTTAHGAGEYGATVALVNTPQDIIGGSVEFRLQSLDDFVDSYQAKAWLIDDNVNALDRYMVAWFQNGEPIFSGITSPTIRVYASDGSVLIPTTPMVAVGAEGTFRYDEASNRILDGVAYFIRAQAAIGGATRTWEQPIGRDS